MHHNWINTAAKLIIRLSLITTASLPFHYLFKHFIPGQWWMPVIATCAVALSGFDLKLIDLCNHQD